MVLVDKSSISRLRDEILQAKEELERVEVEFEELIKIRFYTSLWQNIWRDELGSFVKKPYVVQPVREGEWRLYAPKFLPLEVGWLEYQDDSYSVFRVNKYIDWITPLPDVLKAELGIDKPEFDLTFDWEKNLLRVKQGDPKQVKKKYGRYVYRQLNGDVFQIKSPQRFNFLVRLIQDGILPYRPKPADPNDFHQTERARFQLRDYQEDAWKALMEYSHVGVFYPFGAGKSFLGLYAVAQMKGPKLIVVPSLTLREQWLKRIERYVDARQDEIVVTTYQSAQKDRIWRRDWTAVIVDEVHHLPANTFSMISFIKRRYTLGLSGSPWREDGRTAYIFALTGYPIGADWSFFFKQGIVQKPSVNVYVVEDGREKLLKLQGLLGEKSVTLIYCDSIEGGKGLSKRLGLPFVYSKTRNRLDEISGALERRGNVILSRVGDEGVSLPEIQRIIEYDFLYGSRRQESQRAGRLFHSIETGEHIILMTLEEFHKYKKRLYGLMEKGLDVKVEKTFE